MIATTERSLWTLRIRRFGRRLPPIRAASIIRQVLVHPSNRGDRLRAVWRAVHWQVASRLRGGHRDISVYGGLTLRAYPHSNSASNVIYFTPYFDPVAMTFVRDFLEPGDCFVDCGANIGTYSLLAASRVGPSGKVISFEPVSVSADRLRENVEINALESVIDIRQVAVGASDTSALVSSGSDVSNTLVAVGARDYTEEVRVVALKLEDLPMPPKLVKIDVEGYEREVLRGMTTLLQSPRPPVVLLELTPHLLRWAGTSATEVAEDLESQGFSLFEAMEEQGCFMPARRAELDHHQANYLAIHESTRVEALPLFQPRQSTPKSP